MKRIGHGAVAAMTLAVLLTLGVLSAQAQVLQQIPSDAWVVLKVNNLKAASDKVAKLAQDLGLAAMAPEMADPLGALQAKAKMQQGVDLNGEMAIVFVDPASVGGDSQQAVIALIPVTDYKAFIGNWPEAKTEDGVTEVKLGDDPKPSHFAKWGNYAALCTAKEPIAKPPANAGIKLPAATTKEMAGKDLIVYANFNALRTKLVPQLQEGRTKLLAEMEDNLKNQPQAAKYAPVIKALLGQLLNVAEGFLNQAEAATFGVVLVPEGINTTLVTEFAPNTYAANTVVAVKNTDAPLLSGLPAGKYLIFGGGQSDSPVASKVVTDFGDPIIKELLAVGPEMKPVQDWYDAVKAYVAAQKGQTFGVVAPSGAVGAEPLIQFISIQNGDAKAMSAAYAKMTQAQQDVMKALNLPGAESMKPAYTPNAKTVDGVSFDSIVTKVDMNAQDPVAMQQAQMMNMMYGPQGAVVNYGIVGEKLLIVSGLNDQAVSGAIAAVKAGQAPLAENDRVKAVAAQLPRQRTAVVYIPLDDIVTTALSYAKQFGFAMNVQLPPDLPPIGATFATDAGTALRIDTHIPTPLVQSLVAAGMQAAMQMQGGAPKGGGL